MPLVRLGAAIAANNVHVPFGTGRIVTFDREAMICLTASEYGERASLFDLVGDCPEHVIGAEVAPPSGEPCGTCGQKLDHNPVLILLTGHTEKPALFYGASGKSYGVRANGERFRVKRGDYDATPFLFELVPDDAG